ncbi:MAG: NAD(P)H-dependent flavin oxidoreductase, partial [Candidatus Rokuibacteriota bacterium]
MPEMLRTAVCDLLGIEYPIVQSGMGSVAGPELAAEVSRAGGLGVLAGLNVPPGELRRRIRRIRELTDRPFGVNLWLHSELRPPVDPSTLPDDTVRAVQSQLDRFRERLEIPAAGGRPSTGVIPVDQALDVLLDERVPVFSAGVGNPSAELVRRCHERSVKVIAMVATVADARAVATAGVDAVVAQGGEAGGHRSVGVKPASPEAAAVGTLSLVPQVVDVVPVPVIAAGGIA